MAIKEAKIKKRQIHGGELVSIPLPEGGLSAGQLIRFKDAETVEFGTIEEFEASALSEVTGELTLNNGQTATLVNGLITETTAATITPIADGNVVFTLLSGETITLTFADGKVTATAYDDGVE